MKIQKTWWKALSTVMATTILGMSLVGCDIDVKDAGELPSVDIDPGEMPDVDVHGPDVDIGTTEKKVTVPDVDIDMEEKTVTVPSLDIDIPEEDDQ